MRKLGFWDGIVAMCSMVLGILIAFFGVQFVNWCFQTQCLGEMSGIIGLGPVVFGVSLILFGILMCYSAGSPPRRKRRGFRASPKRVKNVRLKPDLPQTAEGTHDN